MTLKQRLSSVRKSATRLDGRPKVRVRHTIPLNYTRPGMIGASVYAVPLVMRHRIDVQSAKKVKGVLAVLTAADIPSRLTRIILKDMPVLTHRTGFGVLEKEWRS
jgi:hypothetical protein